MSQELTLQNTTNSDDFFSQLASVQAQGVLGGSLKPAYIRLDSESGKYFEAKWNEAEKKQDKVFMDDLQGSILLVKWFAKQKYDEHARIILRTREFSSFTDEWVELLKIDGENTTTEKGFPSYQEFRNEYSTENKLTGKKQSPFDLWASLYIYEWKKNRVINLKVKGTSRKAIFDYLRQWNKSLEKDVKSISQILTDFKSSYVQGEKINYHVATFKTLKVLNDGEQEIVKQSVLFLVSWMKSFKKPRVQIQEAEEVEEVSTVQLIEEHFGVPNELTRVIPLSVESIEEDTVQSDPPVQSATSWRVRAQNCASQDEAIDIYVDLKKSGLSDLQKSVITGTLESKGFKDIPF